MRWCLPKKRVCTEHMHLSFDSNAFVGAANDDPGRTRTCNLWFRRPTPYPLGHRATALLCYLNSPTLSRSLTRQWSSTRDSLQSSCVPLSRSGSTKVSSPSQAASFFHGQTLCSMSVTRTCEEACVPECLQPALRISRAFRKAARRGLHSCETALARSDGRLRRKSGGKRDGETAAASPGRGDETRTPLHPALPPARYPAKTLGLTRAM